MGRDPVGRDRTGRDLMGWEPMGRDPATRQPTLEATRKPRKQPTRQPTRHSTRQPTRQPKGQPSSHPTGQPTRPPTRQQTTQPTRASNHSSTETTREAQAAWQPTRCCWAPCPPWRLDRSTLEYSGELLDSSRNVVANQGPVFDRALFTGLRSNQQQHLAIGLRPNQHVVCGRTGPQLGLTVTGLRPSQQLQRAGVHLALLTSGFARPNVVADDIAGFRPSPTTWPSSTWASPRSVSA